MIGIETLDYTDENLAQQEGLLLLSGSELPASARQNPFASSLCKVHFVW